MKKTKLCFYRSMMVMLVIPLFILSACDLNINSPGNTEAEHPALSADIKPNPDLTPLEVVRLQIEALKYNDADDQGIALTFRFASPSNKQTTGPFRRFESMVKSPAYEPMLNHKIADYDTMSIKDDTATQKVTIIEKNGEATVYIFQLSKQSEEPCVGCWMTDSVSVKPSHQQNLQGA